MLFAKCILNCKCDMTELEQKLVIKKTEAEICLLNFIYLVTIIIDLCSMLGSLQYVQTFLL